MYVFVVLFYFVVSFRLTPNPLSCVCVCVCVNSVFLQSFFVCAHDA